MIDAHAGMYNNYVQKKSKCHRPDKVTADLIYMMNKESSSLHN